MAGRARSAHRGNVAGYTTAHYMPSTSPKPFSLRLSARLRERLDANAHRRGDSSSRLAAELIDEGLRMREHPGIVFRGGPAGRRATLAAGPDAWELVETLRGTGRSGEEAITAVAEWGGLPVAQVRTAIAYYADHREEIDTWIEQNRSEAQTARESWERGREAIA